MRIACMPFALSLARANYNPARLAAVATVLLVGRRTRSSNVAILEEKKNRRNKIPTVRSKRHKRPFSQRNAR